MYPTIIIYVLDTSKNVNPITFMSNMLYACSILYKTKLPFIIVMNKNDIVHHSFAGEWIKDFESFQNALDNETSYVSNLTRSLSLVLDEFYKNIKFVGLSSITGIGVDEFFEVVKLAVDEYEQDYKPEYEKLRQEKEKNEQRKKEKQLQRLEKDMGKGDEILNNSNQPESTSNNSRPTIQIYNQDDENENIQVNPEVDEAQDKIENKSFKSFVSNQMKLKEED